MASTSTTAAPSALLASTVTITTSPPAITSTVYPCADPLPSPGPAYGKYSSPHNLTLVNNLHQGTDGANATDCCNACYFEIENCIQAFYYNVEGCVVAQATNLTSGTGEGVSDVCTVGTFDGLVYGPDTTPVFPSTGTITGPCGQKYENA